MNSSVYGGGPTVNAGEPELSALIERMLAKELEERGTARELAEAAESAAKHANPDANVPFLDVPIPERSESDIQSWAWRHEWEGSCYDAVMERTRLPATQKPQ